MQQSVVEIVSLAHTLSASNRCRADRFAPRRSLRGPGARNRSARWPSVLANLLKRPPPQSIAQDHPHGSDNGEVSDDDQTRVGQQRESRHTDDASEQTPLLSRVASGGRRSYTGDLEGQQKSQTKRPWISGLVEAGHKMEERMTHGVAVAVNPRRWDRKALWRGAVVTPVSCLPAVAVGLLLNILDALCYGMFVCS